MAFAAVLGIRGAATLAPEVTVFDPDATEDFATVVFALICTLASFNGVLAADRAFAADAPLTGGRFTAALATAFTAPCFDTGAFDIGAFDTRAFFEAGALALPPEDLAAEDLAAEDVAALRRSTPLPCAVLVKDADLADADLADTDLADVDFEGADFEGADFDGADLALAAFDLDGIGRRAPWLTRVGNGSVGTQVPKSMRLSAYRTKRRTIEPQRTTARPMNHTEKEPVAPEPRYEDRPRRLETTEGSANC